MRERKIFPEWLTAGMRSWLLTVYGLLVFVVFSRGTLSSDNIWDNCEGLFGLAFLKVSFCLQNQDLFVLPKEHPLPLLECTSELGV